MTTATAARTPWVWGFSVQWIGKTGLSKTHQFHPTSGRTLCGKPIPDATIRRGPITTGTAPWPPICRSCWRTL